MRLMDWNHLIFLQLFRKRPSWELESRSRSNWHSGTGETSSGSMLRSSWSTTIAAFIKVNLSWNSLSLSSWRTLDVLQAAMVNDPLSWTWPGPMSINILIYYNRIHIYIFTRPIYIIYFESHPYLPRSSAEFGLPPRKRKISQEVDARYNQQSQK